MWQSLCGHNENEIEMSSKQISSEKIVILANIWCNIFRYLCYCGGYDFGFVLFLLSNVYVWAVCRYYVCRKREYGSVFVCLYYELLKQNENERKKLIIKYQIYNDSNCNNNKHSRWAQCNSFPLLHLLYIFLSSSSFTLLGFQFPSISCFLYFTYSSSYSYS